MQNRTKEVAAAETFFENNKFFREWAMALLSPPRHDDHHARRRCHHCGQRHAGHHDDNGPSPPPPHSKLSFLLFDFTFGQEFRSVASADSLAVAQEERPATRKGVWGDCTHGDLQIPLWQLPRPQSLSSKHSRRVRSALATTQAS